MEYATWNYSVPGYGKGAVDGIEGTLKRTADAVVARGVDMVNFPNFVCTLQAYTRNIKLNVIDEDEISAVKALLPSKICTFNGTMRVH